VTGTVYTAADDHISDNAVTVTLFTKEGCTLCDKVKDVLQEIRSTHSHTLQQQDITDDDATDWYDRYKYDIPVLHLNDVYWTKHRLTVEEAKAGLTAAFEGRFVEPVHGEPNAKQRERR
jgi:glutaredoxin